MSDPTVITAQAIGGAYAVWVAIGSVPEVRASLVERATMVRGVGARLWRAVWQRLHLAWSWVKAHALRPFGLDRGVVGTVNATGPAAVGSATGRGSGRIVWTGSGATGYSSMEGRVGLLEEALRKVQQRFDEERRVRDERDMAVSSALEGLGALVEQLRGEMRAQAAKSAGRALSLLPYAVWAVILTTAPDWVTVLPAWAFVLFALVPVLMTLLGVLVRRLHPQPA